MSRIVVDAALLSKLRNVFQPVELCDETGRIIGLFTPTVILPPSALEPRISKEEIERRSKLGGGRPLREILADLERQIPGS